MALIFVLGAVLAVGIVVVLVTMLVRRSQNSSVGMLPDSANSRLTPDESAAPDFVPVDRPATRMSAGRISTPPGEPGEAWERAHLKILLDGRTVVAPLSEHPLLIGRSDQGLVVDSSRVLLPDPYISRRHASIEYIEGTYFLRDAGSLNGLELNGQRVSGSRPLESKDRLTIGGIEVIFVDPRRDAVQFPPEPWTDWIFDEYIDGGGMARVYQAHFAREVDPSSPYAGRVAIKVPRYGTDAFSELSGMLVREGAFMHRLSHPNVVRAFKYGSLPCQWPYIAMEYVEGGTLRDYMKRCGGRVPEKDAQTILAQIASALDYVHSAGIIHCDIKPENVLMQGSHVKLADFGIAVTVDEGFAHGWCSYHYVSPEQLQGGRITPQSDIYMLGCLMHEMLTGQVPFEGDEGEVTARKTTRDGQSIRQRFQADTRIDVSPAMDDLVQNMLKRNPEQRPAGARELVLR